MKKKRIQENKEVMIIIDTDHHCHCVGALIFFIFLIPYIFIWKEKLSEALKQLSRFLTFFCCHL